MPQKADIKTLDQLAEYIKYCSNLLEKKGRIACTCESYKPNAGLTQLALLNIWLKEYFEHLNGVKPSEPQLERFRNQAKKQFYADEKADFMVFKTKNSFTGKVVNSIKSSTELDKGEMMLFLNWIQIMASQDGLLLESKGEHKKLNESQT